MVLRTKFIYEICKVLRMITGLYSHFLPSSFNIEREYRHYGIYPFTSTEEKNEVKKNAKIFTKLTASWWVDGLALSFPNVLLICISGMPYCHFFLRTIKIQRQRCRPLSCSHGIGFLLMVLQCQNLTCFIINAAPPRSHVLESLQSIERSQDLVAGFGLSV